MLWGRPRRRWYDTDDTPVDRKAFRLCIYHDDRDRLLDAAIWPDSLLVSEWFFKSQQNKESDQNKRLRLDENEKNGPGAVVAAQVTSVCLDPIVDLGNVSSEGVLCDNASDDTIIGAAYNIGHMEVTTEPDNGVWSSSD